MDLLRQIPNLENLEMDDERFGEIIHSIERVEKCMLDTYVRKYITHKLKDGTHSNAMLQNVFNKVKPIYDAEAKAKAGPKRQKAKFIMVSFDDTQFDPLKYYDIIKPILGLIWLKGSHYTLEQRSVTKDWKGYHMHILLKDNKKPPSEIVRELFPKLQPYVGAPNFIDVETRDHGACMEYIKGNKADPDKLPMIEQDVLMRIHYKINPIDKVK